MSETESFTIHSRAAAPPPVKAWRNPATVIAAATVWNVVIVVVCALLARSVYRMDDFYNLGKAVQDFVALAALLPAIERTSE